MIGVIIWLDIAPVFPWFSSLTQNVPSRKNKLPSQDCYANWLGLIRSLSKIIYSPKAFLK